MTHYTAPGAGFSTHLGSNGSGGDESESWRKSNCLEVVVHLFYGLSRKEIIFTVEGFFGGAMQIIT